MDIGSLAAREQIARERIERATDVLADRYDLADLAAAIKGARNRDVRVEAMMRAEKIADLLEVVVTKTEKRTPGAQRSREPAPPAAKKGD